LGIVVIPLTFKKEKAKDIPVVCDFKGVFLEELLGLLFNHKL